MLSHMPSTAFAVDVMQKPRNHSFTIGNYTLVGVHLPSLIPIAELTRRCIWEATPFWVPKSHLCGPSGVQKNNTDHRASRKSTSFSNDFGYTFRHLSFQLLSLSMLCKNYGIFHFTIGNYTLVGVQRPSLAPQNG